MTAMQRTTIIESDGDIFASGCEALVNPVDCTGAQGAGLAKEFKRRWPATAQLYRGHCRRRRTYPGGVWWHQREQAPQILFAATKALWKDPSELPWIELCLENITLHVSVGNFHSIAIPAIGCGLGELRWPDVRPLILAAAQRMTCERVMVFGPKELI